MKNIGETFEEQFGTGGSLRTFFCPGRVNIIGEHIDYLGGSVLPIAISNGITACIRPNSGRMIRLFSSKYASSAEYDLDRLPKKKQGHWTDYILGVLLSLTQHNKYLTGFDLLIHSNLPDGAGLSSSAALEVLTYFALESVFNNGSINLTELALNCKAVENTFVGVNCGIMDQFAVAQGRAGHAMKLNCNTLQVEHVPLGLSDQCFLIINSNKPRKLAESAYNTRRIECANALQIIRKKRPVQHLVDASINDIDLIQEQTLKKRARHAITEQNRVLEAVIRLKAGQLDAFGELMTASHQSLSSDFEVSCPELDLIVDTLVSQPTCLGARMTGAGFGGCCIALLRNTEVEEISIKLTETYRSKFGYTPTILSCSAADGVRELTEY